MRRRIRRFPGNAQLAVAYLRVSREDLTNGEEAQRKTISSWAVAHNITIVAWFADQLSGATSPADRPGFVSAIAETAEKRAGLFVCANRSRIARDVSYAAAAEQLATDAGAKLVTADGVDSSDTPEARLIRTVLDAFSAYERALIRTRTKLALEAKKARGEALGSIPYGFRKKGRMLEQDEHEQLCLARMRELHDTGHSQYIIAKMLKLEGYKPRGKAWHVSSICRLLKKNS